MKYYSDHLWMGPGNQNFAKIDQINGGWLVDKNVYQDAQTFVEEMNYLHIPMSDTLEWDTFYDVKNQRVLFFPLFPGRIGEPKEGDTFTPYGKWNDVLRAFVFDEEDWFYCMEFHGYTI